MSEASQYTSEPPKRKISEATRDKMSKSQRRAAEKRKIRKMDANEIAEETHRSNEETRKAGEEAVAEWEETKKARGEE